jgi:hypothetical protein
LLLTLAACGPTLTRSPAGWRVDGAKYTIAPEAEDRLMPEGWVLANYNKSGDGFRKESQDDRRDFEIKRVEDDGILVLATEEVPSDAQGKKLEVLADRWFQRVVVAPKDDDEDPYADVVPPLHDRKSVEIGFHTATGDTIRGRSVEITKKQEFTVPNGSGFEAEATLVPLGAPGPDRRLYLSVLRAANGGRLVVIAYANTPAMFDAGVSGASGLAHRVRF